METLIIILGSIFLIVLIALFVLGYLSQSGEAPGLNEGRLQPCPSKPNCVCSELASGAVHFIEPLGYQTDDVAAIIDRLKKIVVQMGGSIEVEKADYLAATFTSAIFRFVDDFEISIDTNAKQIHLRSASRVGQGDGGVNRKRATRLKNAFQSQSM